MSRSFGPGSAPLIGTVRVPGDKSLSHRAVLFSAMAEGTSELTGVLDSADVRSTIAAVAALGARVELTEQPDGSLAGAVTGWGARGPVAPDAPIECGNSGTTTRLLMGVLAGWPISVTLVGDASLSARPMRRVTAPLASMGARFETTEAGTLPVTVHGAHALLPIDFDSPVASAQVKTALLLAGLRAEGRTTVSEPAASRDHTERLLPAFGVPVGLEAHTHSAWVDGPAELTACSMAVPGDPSSAAFLAVAAALVPGSRVTLPGVSLNETRIGFVHVLERMGTDIRIADAAVEGAEPIGTLSVEHGPALSSTTITAEEVPSLVDEVPVLALAAACASGTTRFEGVGELRVKESDRLAAVTEGLSALGVVTRSGADWFEVDGGRLHGGTLDSRHDHRLAMTWALAGFVGGGSVEVTGYDAVDVSYPRFADDLAALAAASGDS